MLENASGKRKSAVILAAEGEAGVSLEMNIGNSTRADEDACQWEDPTRS